MAVQYRIVARVKKEMSPEQASAAENATSLLNSMIASGVLEPVDGRVRKDLADQQESLRTGAPRDNEDGTLSRGTAGATARMDERGDTMAERVSKLGARLSRLIDELARADAVLGSAGGPVGDRQPYSFGGADRPRGGQGFEAEELGKPRPVGSTDHDQVAKMIADSLERYYGSVPSLWGDESRHDLAHKSARSAVEILGRAQVSKGGGLWG